MINIFLLLQQDVFTFFQALSICHTVQVAGESQQLLGDNLSENSATPFKIDYNFHEEEDIANNSEVEDVETISIRPRISNESNSSRPISLSEFERISMTNNITKPLLKSKLFYFILLKIH